MSIEFIPSRQAMLISGTLCTEGLNNMDNKNQVKTTNTQETVGFVLCIICIVVAIFTLLIGTIAAVNITLALVTLVFGLIAYSKHKTNKSLATVIIGGLSLLLGIGWVFI
jgi:hypothetical protein